MKHNTESIFARPQPDGNGYQVSYEFNGSRRIHRFENDTHLPEKPPHGAGSFHDPQQHQALMKRIEAYIKNSCL